MDFVRTFAQVGDAGVALAGGRGIVARDYGIPAVLGTGAATERIHTGDRVHVGGDAGTVHLAGSG